MENLANRVDEVVSLRKYLIRIGDLINLDGPFLTLFGDARNGDLYLYDWVDNDVSANRFIIYSVSAQKVLDYLASRIGRLDLFSAAIDNVYYYADINPKEFSQYKITRLRELPVEYGEIANSFFDDQTCPDLERILPYVNRTIASSGSIRSFRPNASIFSTTVLPEGLLGIYHMSFEKQFVDPQMVFLLSSHLGSESDIEGSFELSGESNKFFEEDLITVDVRKVNHLPTGKRLALYRE
jgi:hypothetical protein